MTRNCIFVIFCLMISLFSQEEVSIREQIKKNRNILAKQAKKIQSLLQSVKALNEYVVLLQEKNQQLSTDIKNIKSITTKLAQVALEIKNVKKYDSGWFYAKTNSHYTKKHTLGVVPNIIQVWYSDKSDGLGNLVLVGSASYSGKHSTTVVNMDKNFIKLSSVRSLADFHNGVGKGAGKRQYPQQGYLRILAFYVPE